MENLRILDAYVENLDKLDQDSQRRMNRYLIQNGDIRQEEFHGLQFSEDFTRDGCIPLFEPRSLQNTAEHRWHGVSDTMPNALEPDSGASFFLQTSQDFT
ncbi:hypothetical protein TNCV_14321 [Trichonephila clavipes]|nr:hypothetical protein TNCV_14321 [Trichonephila clavipes]